MAIGLTPKHTEDFPFHELTQEQFLALSYETAMQLDWKVDYISSNGLIAYTNNGMFSWNAEIKIKMENEIAAIQSASTGSDMMDWGKNKKNVEDFRTKFVALKSTLTLEALETKYQELTERFISMEEDVLMMQPETAIGQITGFFSIFKPTKGFFVTPILIDLIILIFILMAISGANIMLPDNDSLLNWGANFKPLTLNGEWWRLLTNCFLHIGIVHLIMNLFALLYIGLLLEPILGRARFTSAYLLTGITASISSLWWNDLTISAGASGAIFGLYGVFLALLTTDLVEKTARKNLLMSIAFFVGYNLIYGLKGGIDNAAHIGGLLGGLVIGYAFIPSLKNNKENKLKFGTIGVLTCLILVSSGIVLTKTSNDIGIYDTKIKQFASMESKALEVYNLLENASNEEILHAIKDQGIYNWNESIKLIDGFKKLDLPLEIRRRDQLLREYCEVRIKSYKLLYKAISEDTDQYNSQIEECNKQIEEKIAELGE